jgi:hypothetical protein
MHRDLILKADTASRLHALQKFGEKMPGGCHKVNPGRLWEFEGKRPSASGC